jgi:hypothetical protein
VALAGAFRAPQPNGIGDALRKVAHVLDGRLIATRDERAEARVIR